MIEYFCCDGLPGPCCDEHARSMVVEILDSWNQDDTADGIADSILELFRPVDTDERAVIGLYKHMGGKQENWGREDKSTRERYREFVRDSMRTIRGLEEG